MANQARIEITADDRTRQVFASVERNFTGMQRSAEGLARSFSGLGGLLSAGAFIAFTRNAISSAAALDDMAESTGATVEGLSKLTDIARIGGQDIGQVETALVRLTKALAGSDEETKGAGAAFAALGLNIRQLQALAPDQALEKVAQAFARFEDGAGKTSAALALFGKSGAQLLPLLNDIAEQSGRVASLTAQEAADAEKLEKRWNALGVAASNYSRSLVMDLIPGLERLARLSAKKDIGLGGALAATILPRGENIQTKIRELQDELDKRLKERERPGSMTRPGGGVFGALAGISDENLRRRIAALKEIASEEALAAAGDIKDREGRLPLLPIIPSTAPAREKAAKVAKIPGLGDEVPGFQDESVIKENERLRKLAESYKALADPLQKYRDQLDEIRFLRKQNLISAEEATEAEFQIAEAMDKTLGIMEKMPDQVQKTNDLVNELGLTFSSAFEDAIVGGKSLSDVLKALEQDIMKIVTRKLVTEPLAASITGAIGGGGGIGDIFDKIFGGLAVSILGAKDGGIFPGGFQSFASGGLVRQPTLGLVGEGAMNEAIVPLPNGRAIPVEMRGGGATVIMNISTPDVSGFRASQGQILADAQRALTRGRRNL